MMLSFPMPFATVPCKIWLAHEGDQDEWGNVPILYNSVADIETVCAYAPGTQRPETSNDIEDARPYGAVLSMTFYLPKSVVADMRAARIACYPTDDAALSGTLFDVVGEPYSYQRANTPGDFSWVVEGVRHLG